MKIAMKEQEELWLKHIQERMKEHAEPAPADGWQRLQKALDAPSPLSVTSRRGHLLRRLSAAAAVVVLLTLSSLMLWMIQEQTGGSRPHVVEHQPSLVAAVSEETALGQEAREQPAMPRALRHPTLHRPAETPSHHRQNEAATTALPEVESTESEQSEAHAGNSSEEAVSGQSETSRNATPYRPSGKDKLQLPVEKGTGARQRGWSLALAAGNALASGGDILNEPPLFNDRPLHSGAPNGDKLDVASTSDGAMAIPDDSELLFSNGVPYLRNNKEIESIDHKLPVTVAFSVRKRLTKTLSVETGLSYTLLSSDIKYVASSEKVSQKLHYLGIPVRANWSFYDKERFTLYVSAGGAVEKCVYGKVGDEKLTVNPLQFSVLGALGAQLNLSRRVGIYAEPGVSYFFKDGSGVQTIRKEHPLNFTLQAGLRLSY
ncbi:MAG: PorT family protein [Prevotellaceae bacterium]|jgi:hypothetical protein|nr:PorT family protein [Prevotellaceae bacterium]